MPPADHAPVDKFGLAAKAVPMTSKRVYSRFKGQQMCLADYFADGDEVASRHNR